MRKRLCVWIALMMAMCTANCAFADGFRFRLEQIPFVATAEPDPTPVPGPTEPPVPEVQPYLDGVSAFPKEAGEARKVLLSFLGDCTLGCNEIDHGKKKSIDYYVEQYGYGYCFDRVKSILELDDLTVANLECVLSDSMDGLDKTTRKVYNFRAYESYVSILEQGSVEAVTIANNHIGDYGQPGFDATCRVLDGSALNWFGSTDFGGQYFVFETEGVKIGFMGSYYQYYWQHEEEMLAMFNEMREKGCQVIIAVMHGGVEYDKRHDRNQSKMARKLIQWGADVVVGHHPHVLQGYEILEGVPVYYSIGNFVFAGNFNIRTPYTVIMQLALSFDEENRYLGCRANMIPCRLSTHEEINYYQPYPVTGVDAVRAIKKMQYDAKQPYPLLDYIENIGAMQDFVPARE